MRRHPLNRRRDRAEGRLVDGLGLASLAVGAIGVLAPRAFTRGLGMRGLERQVTAHGLWDVANGLGLLASARPLPWLLGRAGTAALELAELAPRLDRRNPNRAGLGIAAAGLVGMAAVGAVAAASILLRRPGAAQPASPLYADRSGFPRSPTGMRGAARDFDAPEDFRTPKALRPLNG